MGDYNRDAQEKKIYVIGIMLGNYFDLCTLLVQ